MSQPPHSSLHQENQWGYFFFFFLIINSCSFLEPLGWMYNTIFWKFYLRHSVRNIAVSFRWTGLCRNTSRAWIKFWEVITLEQELCFKHLEEPLSLTITCTENWRNPASWCVTWNKCWIRCVNTLQCVCLVWLRHVRCHCCNFWSLAWLGPLQCCTEQSFGTLLKGWLLTTPSIPSVPKSRKNCVRSESIARQKCCMTEPSNRAAFRTLLFQSSSH